MTLFTAVMGWFFFTDNFPDLSLSYLWGIRLGIILFVIFAFEGGAMGAQMSHTVGAADGGTGTVQCGDTGGCGFYPGSDRRAGVKDHQRR